MSAGESELDALGARLDRAAARLRELHAAAPPSERGDRIVPPRGPDPIQTALEGLAAAGIEVRRVRAELDELSARLRTR